MQSAARDRDNESSRPRGTVAVVTRRALEFQLARDLYAEERDLVLIGSVNDAYSQIRRVAPDLIVVYLSGNDVDGCRLLSMLALDRDISRVPLVTYISAETTSDDANERQEPPELDTVN